MPVNEPKLFLVCYDIANPKRLVRVHRYLKKQGMPLQYSVFLVQETGESMDQLLDDLSDIINAKKDDIRAYSINSSPEYVTLGRQQLPEGLLWLGEDTLVADCFQLR